MAVEGAARLLRKAKAGDRQALGRLQKGYSAGWLDAFHPDLAARVKRLDSERLLGSSMAEVLASGPRLESGPVFFTWVTLLIRFKFANSHLWSSSSIQREGSAGGASKFEGRCLDSDLLAFEAYVQTVQVILDSFPTHPEEMATVSLKLLDGLSLGQIAERLGDNSTKLYARLQDGARLLQGCFTS